MQQNLYSLFIFILFFSVTVSAEPVINIKNLYYPVSGNTNTEIYNSLQHNGPGNDKGEKFHAQTRWKIHWGYRWVGNQNVCQVIEEEVHVEISILMPQHQAIEKLNPQIRSSWTRYYDALLNHEHQHRDFGLAAASELEQALIAFEAKECSNLENELNQLADSILNRNEQMEREFDRKTNHGINQGVILK